ncbi:MAG: aminotransferase class I/II-fold pyridoxal phosphate-dependent enzyme [Eubacterium sp.]|nr:aminotransferase class I/II-fold pyridoxal phosphate-dependent enzyme [Eubacterium sp.]
MKTDSHGGNIYKKSRELGISEDQIMDFSANISPLGLPQEIRRAIIESIDGLINYPDPECSRLREAIAAHDKVREEWISCGNGGADLLYRIAFGMKPGKVLLPVPAFVEYEEALRTAGSRITYHRMGQDLLPGEDLIPEITEDYDMLVLCNPNNPTGLMLERDYLIRVLDQAKKAGVFLLLDECFLEICLSEEERTLIPYLEKYDNLLILKSFTKLYALPGIRLGYLLSSNQDVIGAVNRAGQSWSVSSLAQEAGIRALTLTDYKDKVRKLVAEELCYMKKELAGLPIRLYDGQANYLFFRAPGCRDLDRQLEKKGFMIRNCSNYVNLGDDYWRIAVKDHASNRKMIRALKDILL